jgi:Zn-dependent peptidase ImmA (M78 family)
LPPDPERWTNRSVIKLAAGNDPVKVISEKARAVVVDAIDKGWGGPPFDPIWLANHLGIPTMGRDDVRDARIVAREDGGLVIEFNPSRPRNRTRYSIAHEIGHTLFPDCSERIRHRAAYHELRGDEWQLEALCNIAAAEFLMPVGSFPNLARSELSVDHLLGLRQEYGVSTESLLIRVTRRSAEPVAMFAASRFESRPGRDRYQVDYSIQAPAWRAPIRRGMLIPEQSVVSECTAIGYTAKGREKWQGSSGEFTIECVGIPPYPSGIWPRVVGLLTTPSVATSNSPDITYLKGDALEPRGEGPVIVAQVVNDATANWGGRGFAKAVKNRAPAVQEDFRRWVAMHRARFSLGESRLYQAAQNMSFFSMICQEGYGPSATPRLRYAPLQKCLIELGDTARQLAASVHMPRIGAGQAGGSWEIIEELIRQEVCGRDVPVTVYDLPGPTGPPTRIAQTASVGGAQ